MLPLAKSYPTVRAQDISARVSQAVPTFPTVLSDLIGQYAQTDFSRALKPLSKTVHDAELNEAIKEAFASPECDPQIKTDIIRLAIQQGCKNKLRLLIAELLDSGQDVYLNNMTFPNFCCQPGLLFFREDLTGKSFLPPDRFGKVHFSGAKLSNLNFDLAYLPWAIFKGAKFDGTELRGAVLYGADFTDTDIEEVHFEQSPHHTEIYLDKRTVFTVRVPVRTDLRFATFAGSNIARSVFIGAIMSNTNLIGTRNTHLAEFYGSSLREAIVYDPDSSISWGASQDALWTQIYININNKFPSARQLVKLRQTLCSCDTNQLLIHAHKIGELRCAISEFVAFTKQPGGENYEQTLWLMKMGIVPGELAAFIQFRTEGLERLDAVKLIKEQRQPVTIGGTNMGTIQETVGVNTPLDPVIAFLFKLSEADDHV